MQAEAIKIFSIRNLISSDIFQGYWSEMACRLKLNRVFLNYELVNIRNL